MYKYQVTVIKIYSNTYKKWYVSRSTNYGRQHKENMEFLKNNAWKVESVWKIYFPWKTLHPGSFMGVFYKTFKYEIMPLTISERRKKLAKSLHRANATLIWNSETVKGSKTVYRSHIWANCEALLILPPYYHHRINHALLAATIAYTYSIHSMILTLQCIYMFSYLPLNARH